MPLRTLVILVAIALIVLAVRRLWQSSRPTGKQPQKSAHMVKCTYCGVYVPESEALSSGNHFYCSGAHLKEDREKKG